MNVVTADNRPDGMAASRSQRRRRGQSMADVEMAAAAEACTAEPAAATREADNVAASAARDRRTGMTLVAPTASRMTRAA